MAKPVSEQHILVLQNHYNILIIIGLIGFRSDTNYHAYQARQNFLREQKTIQIELEDEREARLQALIALREATEREQAALREKQSM